MWLPVSFSILPLLPPDFRQALPTQQFNHSTFHPLRNLPAMPLILNIDTAVQSASVCLAEGTTVLAASVNPSERESAAWLHTAVQELLAQAKVPLHRIDAVAVSAGPGSYTGLRVGMAAAKGLCYALSVPLLAVPTLQMMAVAAGPAGTALLCPMIDARRMEVFTALYDAALAEVLPATNAILDPASFASWLQAGTIYFFGNGSGKAANIIQHTNAIFRTVAATAEHMVPLSAAKFERRQFSDLAYSEPFYGKDFHAPVSKKNY